MDDNAIEIVCLSAAITVAAVGITIHEKYENGSGSLSSEADSSSVEDDANFGGMAEEEEVSSLSFPSPKQSLGKKKRDLEDDPFATLAVAVNNAALAIENLKKKNQLIVKDLYAEVMKIEGYDEMTPVGVFDHLVENELLGRAFMAKNAYLRKICIQQFLNKRGGPTT